MDWKQEVPQKYVVEYDKKTKVWRILDAWHEAMVSVNRDDEIPDDHPALKIITDGEMGALIRELRAEGVLEPSGEERRVLETPKKKLSEVDIAAMAIGSIEKIALSREVGNVNLQKGE